MNSAMSMDFKGAFSTYTKSQMSQNSNLFVNKHKSEMAKASLLSRRNTLKKSKTSRKNKAISSKPKDKFNDQIITKGSLYSRNKVNAIVSRIKSPVLMQAQMTYYSSRFGNLDREIQVYRNKHQEKRVAIRENLGKLKSHVSQVKAQRNSNKITRHHFMEVMKKLRTIKMKLEKSNLNKTDKSIRDNKECQKDSKIKASLIKKKLASLFVAAENRLHRIGFNVNSQMVEIRKGIPLDKSTPSKPNLMKSTLKSEKPLKPLKKAPKSGSNVYYPKTSVNKKRKSKASNLTRSSVYDKKYLKILRSNKARIEEIFRNHQNLVRSDFNRKLQRHKKKLLAELSDKLEIVRKQRSLHHSNMYKCVRKTKNKVLCMLDSRKIDLSY